MLGECADQHLAGKKGSRFEPDVEGRQGKAAMKSEFGCVKFETFDFASSK